MRLLWKEKVRNKSWIGLDNVYRVAKKKVIFGQTHTGKLTCIQGAQLLKIRKKIISVNS